MGVVIQSRGGIVFVSDTGIIWAGKMLSYTVRVYVRALNPPIILTGHALVELAKIYRILDVEICGWSYKSDLFLDIHRGKPMIFCAGRPQWPNVFILEKLVNILTTTDSPNDVRQLSSQLFRRRLV